jgi:hypothetical protein
MTSFDWWRAMAGPGKFMCAICYEAKPVEQASVDPDGVKWDVCQECTASERAYGERLLDALVDYWHDTNDPNVTLDFKEFMGFDDELMARWVREGNSAVPDDKLWELGHRAKDLKLESWLSAEETP